MCCDESVRIAETLRVPGRESAATREPVRHSADDFESLPCCMRRPLDFPDAVARPRTARVPYEDRLARPASWARTVKYRRPVERALQSADRTRTNAFLRIVAAGRC